MDTSEARRIASGTFEGDVVRPDEQQQQQQQQQQDAPFDELSQPFYDAVEVPLSWSSTRSSPYTSAAATVEAEPEQTGTVATDSTSSRTGRGGGGSTASKDKYPRRPSDVGSIPLKTHSLEIINGLSPGSPIPGLEKQPSNDQLNENSSTGANNGNMNMNNNKKSPARYHNAPTSDPDEKNNSIRPQPSTDLVNFLNDDPRDMTYGRRIALWMMKRYKWYNPHLEDSIDRAMTDDVIDEGKFRTQDGYPISHSKEERPSLEKAWAYFDRVALPRYLYEEKENPGQKKSLVTRIFRKFRKADKQLQRAEPGEPEKPTRLYSPLWTPHKQLGDFGLGIGLYFSTIRALTLLVFIAGLINIPNFIYFSGPEYSNNQLTVGTLLRGSAICTETKWVACPDCQSDDFRGDPFYYNNVTGVKLARKNLCNGATLEQGMVNFATLIFVILACYLLCLYLNKMEVAYDEDEQTAQDYSIVINNPPEDATDPEEWKEFFKNAFDAHVTGCTVAVDNDILVHALRERREKMRMLELLVEPGTKLDIVTLAGIAAAEERKRTLVQRLLAMVSPGIPEIFSRLAVLTAKVQGLAQQDYPVTNVFITFETEASQRMVLQKLSVGQAAVDANRTSSVRDLKYLFRGFRILSVHEPEEPDSIIWEDLNVTLVDRLKQQFFTVVATFAALVLVAFVVRVVNEWNPFFSSYTISITNALFPMFAKILTYNESHPSYGSLQTSLFFKIAVFRWTTTAIIITMITPFEDTIYNGVGGLIYQIQAQFIAEVTTTSAIQLADPVGHLQRHFLAPRKFTQDAMNLMMQGSIVELAERYTAVAKLLFLTFWYCAIYPGAFFFCAFALQTIYFLDRLSLMRTWKRVPKLGSTISQFNMRYFLPLSVLAMAIFSSYYWSGFPFDNLCVNEGERVPEAYFNKTHNIPAYKPNDALDVLSEIETVSIGADEYTYRYCLQDYLRARGRQTFPFIPQFQPEGEEWMTEEQEQLTTIYGWSAFGLFLAFCIFMLWLWIWSFFSYFRGSYDPTGVDQGENFSELDSMNLYIPQVVSSLFSYPLLACSVDDIDKDMLDWTDPEHPHAFYDLTKDAQALIRGSDISEKVVFSQVSHWPPDKETATKEATH